MNDRQTYEKLRCVRLCAADDGMDIPGERCGWVWGVWAIGIGDMRVEVVALPCATLLVG